MTSSDLRYNKPDKTTLLSLLLGIHLSALPFYFDIPISVLLLIILLSFWQFYIIKNNRSNPGRFAQLCIIVISYFIIFYSYGHILGRQPGIALIALMTVLKLFETKSLRDCYIIIYSSFFIIASNFFQSQTIWLIIYVFCVVIFLVSILIAFSDKLKTIPLQSRLKLSARFISYAIPLMLILFVLFPRIPGPLWGLPDDAFTNKTGLSEEMSPGSINNLISSSAIAFRVKFNNLPPKHSERYWRGVALSTYDGKTWRRNDAPKSTEANIDYSKNTPKSRYTVTLEPTNLNWLLALEYAQSYDKKYQLNREAMLIAKDKVTNVINYTIESHPGAVNTALFPQESYKNRLLPVGLNPQSISFAQTLLQESNFNNIEYINNVLGHFSNNEFFYTLKPDLLGTHAMDDFLFTSRRGFCEHYASAFTTLMRAAGIPSRVVIGYQGGKMNPLDDYMIVRQSDAHAWAEVWLTDQWVRIDPTAAVSPERIEQGIEDAGLERNKLPLILLSNNDFIKNTMFLYDSFQNSWNQWVIGFDQQKQNDLLRLIGLEGNNSSNLILLLVICVSITGLISTWFFLRNVAKNNDRVQHFFNIFCLKLKAVGVHHQLNEGPLDFEHRIIKQLKPENKIKNEIQFILKAYRRFHFGNLDNDALLKKYIHKIKKLRIKN